MVSMLDCIRREPVLLDAVIENCKANFDALFHKYGDYINVIDEIVFIGSGTSNTSSITARYFAEKASGVRVTVSTPSEFITSLSHRNKNALHVFISQTGTSIVTGEALNYVRENNMLNAAVSEASTTPIAAASDVFINMGCGHEEYPMRTIGYSTSVLTLMLLGLEFGLRRGYISEDKYTEYLESARKAVAAIPAVIDGAMLWLDKNRRPMLRAEGIFLYGSDALYGVALEGAVKIWETPQIISAGYELEEGLHGPNYGFTHRHSVIALNDGGANSSKSVSLAKWMKYEKQNGFIIGADTADTDDFAFTPDGGEFSCLQFAAVVQVLAYRLAYEQGRDLFAPHDNSVMNKYFQSHSEN